MRVKIDMQTRQTIDDDAASCGVLRPQWTRAYHEESVGRNADDELVN